MIQKVFEIGRMSFDEFRFFKNFNSIPEEEIIDAMVRLYFLYCKNNTTKGNIIFKFSIPIEDIKNTHRDFVTKTSYIKIYPKTLDIIESFLNAIEIHIPDNKNSKEELKKFIFTDILVLMSEYLLNNPEEHLFSSIKNLEEYKENNNSQNQIKSIFISKNNFASS